MAVDRITQETGRAEGRGTMMRELTRSSGPRSPIRIINLIGEFDGDGPLAVPRGRPTSSADGPELAAQNDETNPMSIWVRFAECKVPEGWCQASANRRNKPNVNLGKICGTEWIGVSSHSSGKMTQTEPFLPGWQPVESADGSKSIKRSHSCRNGSRPRCDDEHKADERTQLFTKASHTSQRSPGWGWGIRIVEADERTQAGGFHRSDPGAGASLTARRPIWRGGPAPMSAV
jgi:hypothetical protein